MPAMAQVFNSDQALELILFNDYVVTLDAHHCPSGNGLYGLKASLEYSV
jgi:hypothetical protein